MPSGGGLQPSPAGQPGGQPITSIPLTKVTSKGQSSEKTGGMFHRRGRKPSNQLQKQQAKKAKKVNFMGRIYNGILNFSVITRYLLLSFPLGAVIAVPIVLGVTVFGRPGSTVTASGIPIAWVFTWVEVVWVSLWASKLFAKILPRIFEFLAGVISPGVKKYSLAIQRLEVPISMVGWAVTSLATFMPILQHHPEPKNQCADLRRPAQPGQAQATTICPDGTVLGDLAPWTTIVQNVLAALTICTLLFLAEKAFVQFVSINYHAMQYDNRIKESKRSVYLLGVLYEASRALFEPFCPEFRDEDLIINDSIAAPSQQKLAQGRISGSATPQKLLHNVGRFGEHIHAALGRVAHEISGKEVAANATSHATVIEALEEKHSCEALARRIWMSLVVEGKDALYPEDVQEVLADRSQDEAMDAFKAVDRDDNGDVTLDEMILTVCEIGRERKAVANSLHNIGSAINVLDNLLVLITAIGAVLVIVAFLNQNFNTMLVSAGTALLSLSFVFSATAAEILSSCIFLFVKHPYDVDDRVDISGEQLVVERISLLYTVFRSVSTHKTKQAPNSVLNSLWIENVTRSKAMREQLKIYISFDTTLEDIELLRREMQKFVLEKENMRDFESEVLVELTGLAEMNKMELNVEVRHKSNWANEMVRSARRSKFMCALVLALRRVPIYAPGGGTATLGSADQPSYSVAVTVAEAEAARQAYADAKESKHLNSDAVDATGTDAIGQGAGSVLRNRDQPLAPTTETNAMAMLNSRAPAFDPNPLSPDRREGFSPIDETAEDMLLRRQSTGGKRRQSPQYHQPDPVPEYGYPPPRPSQDQVNNFPRPPSQQGPPPPNYAQYPQPPPQQPRMMPQNLPGQHVGYSGRSQSPAAGPRYAYPPGQQQQQQQPMPPPTTYQQQGRTSPERPPRPQPPGNYQPGGYGPQ